MAAGHFALVVKYTANGFTGVSPGFGGWATNTLKFGIMGQYYGGSSTPHLADSDPRWGSGGSQNWSTGEVTPGGNYSAGGITLTGATINAPGQGGSVTIFKIDSPILLTAHASNPTNAYWGVFYDSTDSGKHVIGLLDLGGPISLVSGLQIRVQGLAGGTAAVFRASPQP